MTTTLLAQPPVAGDRRVVCGATCCWWDFASRMATKSTARGKPPLPCCPHCRGVLFEVDSIETWTEGVERYAAENDDPAYPVFMHWLRGRCFPHIDQARAAWRLYLATTGN